MVDFYALEARGGNGVPTYALEFSGKLSELLGHEKVGQEWGEQRSGILKLKSDIISRILNSRELRIGVAPLSLSRLFSRFTNDSRD